MAYYVCMYVLNEINLLALGIVNFKKFVVELKL